MTEGASEGLGQAHRTYAARSKMLDMYTAHIAELLAEAQHEIAAREALNIPHIAVALADAGLRSTCAGYQRWCSDWIQPDFGSAIYENWCARVGECEPSGNGVPFAALRALRLGRLAREVPILFMRPSATLDRSDAQGITCALLGAVSRWFEQDGRYQQIVQTNLGRLGVLR